MRRLVIALLLLAMPVVVSAEDWAGIHRETYAPTTPNDRGGVGVTNWGEQTVSATGIGVVSDNPVNAARERASAMRAAKIVALRNLLEQTKGVQITSQTTIRNFETVDDTIIARVSGVVQGATEVGNPRYMSDGSIERTFAINLTGQISEAVMVEDFNVTPHPADGSHDGLIIDAKGSGVMPALSPKIYSESGELVYGPVNCDRDYAVQMGVVGYVRTVEQAKSNDRAGSNPLVISAVKATGAAGCDIVISNSDASMLPYIRGINECKVTVVL
ncbi:MAG: hypothetical protein GF399_00070 [Candidatus Coatesbacteria bacterium]|nr:hypothetical protein [Candidatus Coatesbacteria bacterium]